MATRDFDTERWVDERLSALAPPDDWAPDQARGVAALRNRAPRRSRGWKWMAVATATAAIVLVLAPVPTVKGFAHACGEFVRRSLSGGSATHASAGGERLPFDAMAMTDLEGRPLSLSDYRGKVVLVTYWTPSCTQCLAEMLWFEEFEQRYRQRDFAVIAITGDASDPAAVARAFEGKPLGARLRFGSTKSALPNAMPTTVLLDRSGRVAVRHTGYCSKREFETDIQALLDER
jgi:thiol-disulfide isomerase/thioredoxin